MQVLDFTKPNPDIWDKASIMMMMAMVMMMIYNFHLMQTGLYLMTLNIFIRK